LGANSGPFLFKKGVEMTEKLVFRKVDGTKIDDVNQYVAKWAVENPHGHIYIGCDSQEHSNYVKYAISIVMHYKDQYGMGKGAHVINSIIMDRKYKTSPKARYSKNGKKFFDTSLLQEKLWKEVEFTIQAASLLDGCEKKITIHVDYNSKAEEVSNMLYSSGIGYAKGFGFEAEGKPHAWAATHVADTYCR